MAALRIHALMSNRWFWRKFIFRNNFITFHANSYKSIACRWEKQLFLSPHHASDTQRHFTHSKLLHNVSPAHTRKEWVRVELIFWCFDKVKCHWETKISLKAYFAAISNPSLYIFSHPTRESCEHFFPSFMKNLSFYCFRHLKRWETAKGKSEENTAQSREPYAKYCKFWELVRTFPIVRLRVSGIIQYKFD